ncbi:MAG: secretion system protein [Desulfurococcales archaeon ex4484_217_2]|nr:MAG: secretion system protein [Desulfurococcales archaeon ex4484_217_2]
MVLRRKKKLVKGSETAAPIKRKLSDDFWNFIYSKFRFMGKVILYIFPNIPQNIKSANIRLYYEVYACFVGFLFLVSLAVSVTVIVSTILFVTYVNELIIATVVFFVLLPALMLVFFGQLFPKAMAASRGASMDQEVPYAVAYLTIMATGGLSPHRAFERLAGAKDVFRRISYYASRFIVVVKALGKDPITAFDDLARRSPSDMFRDLLLGYAATIRVGGDLYDYLKRKVQGLFMDLVSKMRIAGDRMATILEAYLAIIIFVMLAMDAIYLINTSIPAVSIPAFSGVTLFLFSYILLPFISGAIMYIADVLQYKEPWTEIRPYIVYFGISLPLMFIFSVEMFLPFYLPKTHVIYKTFEPFVIVLSHMGEVMNIDPAFLSSIGLGLALVIPTLPAAIYEIIISREVRGLTKGITSFLRDLVEVRKTGLSPEKCIIVLSARDYGIFSKHLRDMAMRLSLGFSLSRIYSLLVSKIRAWRAKVFLYILTDAIEVGGGSPETLESMAWFAEMSEHVEKEKAASMRTLMVIPYIGAITVIISMVFLAVFMKSLALSVGAYRNALMLVMPATILNVYIMGLVTGKIANGTVSSGFKHAIILSGLTLILLLTSSVFEILTAPFVTQV